MDNNNIMNTRLTFTYNTQYVMYFNRAFGSHLTTMVHAISRYEDDISTRSLLNVMEYYKELCEAYESHDLFTTPICRLSRRDKKDVFDLFRSLDELVLDMAKYIDDKFDKLVDNWDYVTQK